MLDYIIVSIIGIVIYQIIVFIIYLCTNENDDILAISSMIVPYVFVTVIGFIYRKLYLAWCRNNLNGYRFYWRNDNSDYINSGNRWFAKDKDVVNLNFDETSQYYIKKIIEGKNLKSILFKREMYKGQDTFQGWDMNKFRK